MGITATGRQYTIAGIDIHKLRDGRMAEHWHVVDLYGLLLQLGAIPSSEITPA
jgi:predicted ester cyclase